MEIKTQINEISLMFKSTFEMINTFKQNQLMLECEEFVYELLLEDAKYQLRIELEKAKKLINGN